MTRLKILFAVLIFAQMSNAAFAQWKIVAPKLLPPGLRGSEPQIGAIHIKQSIIWAGVDTLWSSADMGKTWQRSPLKVNGHPANGLSDIDFFDRNIGVIGADGIYLTEDGGQTWKNIGVKLPTLSVIFGSTDSIILGLENDIGGAANDQLQVTTDMGNTWQTKIFGVSYGGGEGLSLTKGKDGTIYLFSFYDGLGGIHGWIESSSDDGQTWLSNTGDVDGDSYTITADSCNASTLFLAHEGCVQSLDKHSHIFVSSDAGVIWQATFTDSVGVIAGSITAGKTAIYAGTMNSTGVLRSLDQGNTWQSIGGPVLNWDSRGLAAMNDDTIFAIDTAGNIWATFNSGGDSITASSYPPDFSASPASLFSTDTVYCDSLVRTVSFTRLFCSPYPDSVVGWSIIGADSMSYNASNLTPDSILVTLYGVGTKSGNQQAQLALVLNNGTSETVSLAGYVNTSASALTLSTSDVKTDTLGATLSVPITINNLQRPEDVDLVLHYDGTVDYLCSLSPLGDTLDIPGQKWAGRSKLHIAGAVHGVVAGYSRFIVFNDSAENAHATFDSVNVLTAISPCEYSMPEAVTSTITPPSGCGITILSQFFHLGIGPTFSVRPNPANGDVWISSSAALGDVTIAIYDMLGSERSEIVASVSKDNPIALTLPQADGVYNIAIHYSGGVKIARVVRQHY